MKDVLIVEDHPDLRDIFASAFRSALFSVRTAENGQIAMECLEQRVPDVIVLDINIPKRSGYEVLAYVRSHQTTHDIKVIVVTGNSLALDDQKAEYADLVLMKPIRMSELITFAARLTDEPVG
jgi:CheY-like chemotaxis protein